MRRMQSPTFANCVTCYNLPGRLRTTLQVVKQMENTERDKGVRMRVLVTGGAGFIGKHLVKALLERSEEVVVLDNMWRGERSSLSEDVHFIEGDIRDFDVIRRAISNCGTVYHLAGQSNVMGAVSNSDYSFTSNVVGTYNLLKSAVEANVKRVVFTSSREVYGEVGKLPVSEDQPTSPKNPYGASKVAGEAYCRVFQSTYGIDVNVVRLANVYGVGDRNRVIPNWLDQARKGEDLTIYGGAQVLDFVPISLVVRAILAAGALSFQGTPINVGSGKGIALQTLAASILALPGVHSKLRILPARTIEVVRYISDVTRMKAVLGLTPPSDPLEDLPIVWEHVCAKS